MEEVKYDNVRIKNTEIAGTKIYIDNELLSQSEFVVSVIKGEEKIITLNVESADGYEFIGWYYVIYDLQDNKSYSEDPIFRDTEQTLNVSEFSGIVIAPLFSFDLQLRVDISEVKFNHDNENNEIYIEIIHLI